MKAGDLLFFKAGPEGAHQLFNSSDRDLRYLDLVVSDKADLCEYFDSGKVYCAGHTFRKADEVGYFDGEEAPAAFWRQSPSGKDETGQRRSGSVPPEGLNDGFTGDGG